MAKTEHDVIYFNVLLKKTKNKTDENLNKCSGKITVDKTQSKFMIFNYKNTVNKLIICLNLNFKNRKRPKYLSM